MKKTNNPRSYGVREANQRGIGRVVRDAEEDGTTFLTRSNQTVAMIVPLTPVGMRNFANWMVNVVGKDKRLKEEAREGIQAMFAPLLVDVVELGDRIMKDQTEDRATVGTDLSAGLVKGGSRRQKKPAASPTKKSPSSKR